MSVLCLIQARSASTRLPNKVLEDIAGLLVIEHVYRRVKAAGYYTLITAPTDQRLSGVAANHGLNHYVWYGPEDDVLNRFRAACRLNYNNKTPIIVRITADCPFIQPSHIRACATLAKLHGFVRLSRREGWPDGLDVEAFTADYLFNKFTDHEHVTAGVDPVAVIACNWPLAHHRWTLDTSDDLAWFRRIAAAVNCEPPWHPTVNDLLEAIAKEPSLGHYT